MKNDEIKEVPEFWYQDAFTGVIYNLAEIPERYRLREDLTARGFFLVDNFKRIYQYFDMRKITKEQFDEMFNAFDLFNWYHVKKAKGKIEAQ